MGWLLVLVVLIVAGVGAWALFRADETEGGGALLGGTRTGPKELPPPPPLPGYRPPPPPPSTFADQAPSPLAEQTPSRPAADVPEHLLDFVPATIWSRFLARLIDSFIAGLFTVFVGVVGGLGAARRGSLSSATVVTIVSILVFTAFYEIGFIAVLGQTPGKMFMKVRVISALDGGVPTVAQALVRWAFPSLIAYLPRIIPGSPATRAQFGTFAGLLTLLIYLWALWDPRKQGLHDKAAATLVQNFRF